MLFLYDKLDKMIFDDSERLRAGRPDLVVIDEDIRAEIIRGVPYDIAVSARKQPQEAPETIPEHSCEEDARSATEAVLVSTETTNDDIVSDPQPKRRGRRRKING